MTREPVSTPAGMRTLTVSYFGNTPLPWQSAQGGRRFPVPLQAEQFWSKRKNPPPAEIFPVPLQAEQETDPVAAAPDPWQRAQVSLRRTLMLAVRPFIASSKLSASGTSMSAPRRDCDCADAPFAPPPNSSLKMSRKLAPPDPAPAPDGLEPAPPVKTLQSKSNPAPAGPRAASRMLSLYAPNLS